MEWPELEDWQEWKARCARQLCSAATQRRLGRFAEHRFAAWLRRCRSISNLTPQDLHAHAPRADEAWHLFETHAMLTQTRSGKSYKDWIFARQERVADLPLNAVQSGATLILRDAVRGYLCRETARRQVVSLDAPLPGCATPLTLHDLLPGNADGMEALAEQEADRLARRHAETVFRLLRPPERMGLLARFLGLPVSDPEVLRATGLSQSRLNHVTRRVITRIHDALRQHYRHDSADTIRTLTLKVVDHLEQHVFAWRQSEPCLPHFLQHLEAPRYVSITQD